LDYAVQGETHTVDLPSGILQIEGNTVIVYLATTLENGARAEEEQVGRLERLAAETLAVAGGRERLEGGSGSPA
jgi:hypothetical protein